MKEAMTASVNLDGEENDARKMSTSVAPVLVKMKGLVQAVGSYSCQCKPDWEGQTCEQKDGLNVFILSQGYEDGPNVIHGKCMIKVNNVDHCPNTRGHNVVVLDKSGGLVTKRAFDTQGDQNASVEMGYFLTNLPNERIVLIAIMDSGDTYVGNAENGLRSVGAVNPNVTIRESWLLVGYKGGSPSWITEKRADRGKGPSQANVTIPQPIIVPI